MIVKNKKINNKKYFVNFFNFISFLFNITILRISSKEMKIYKTFITTSLMTSWFLLLFNRFRSKRNNGMYLLFLSLLSPSLTYCQKTQESQVVNYKELPNPIHPPSDLWKKRNQNFISWGSTYERYKKEAPPSIGKAQKRIHLKGWKGEKLNAQFLVSTYKKPLNLSIDISDLKSSSTAYTIKNDLIETNFVRYVITDELNHDGKGGCGPRNAHDFDSTLVADPLDNITEVLPVPLHTTRPVWLKINIPPFAPAGTYKGFVKIKDHDRILKELIIYLKVINRTLPASKEWKFHLDLWQNPYAAARYYQVDPWSKAHFSVMKKDLKHYVEAGGKSITASIINKPWNGQTYDAYHSMVKWTLKKNGSWKFDFTTFDKWVTFMTDLGITKQINCYSMVPWSYSFDYFDEATNTVKTIKTQPGDPTYNRMWKSMLISFADHLEKKGWFEKTFIAMDERPKEVMLSTIALINSTGKNFNISFAGEKHAEIMNEIKDYCFPIDNPFSPETIINRKKKGFTTTFYTSCSQSFPNSFTFSDPGETEYYGWYAASHNLDGYLRWAYASWVAQPLLDSRYKTWAAGDTYLIYPDGRSSIRFEKLLEGIQYYEKIRVLKKELRKNTASWNKLEKVLEENKSAKNRQTLREQLIESKEIINSL
ncbi:hypothetical protein C7S20_18755 [Christiangramia fulva]|uniref:Uncharacterized protein n=1 Tax=Christiangramia fulva TaxID=2126553 RepID=A0A2R3ZA01_9FLAO|nr:DUF4091 domain-containing protein [Christiangramia fulva]AVR47125.1 hypothetical protein C7S20_18755 [Christiangramia fulva]